MSDYLRWYVPERVVYIPMPDQVDYDYLEMVNDELIAWLEAHPSDELLHIITNALAVKQAPSNLVRLRRSSPVFDHPRVGWALLVSDNALYRFFGSTVPQMLTGNRSRAFNTLEDALDFLHEQVTDVAWDDAQAAVLQRD